MKDQITVIIPICAIPSHPGGEVLEEVLLQIRNRLPDVEIILMFDATSQTLMHLKDRYEQYKTEMLWKINNEMENVTPLIFSEHRHQSQMTIKALERVRTPLILWSEQDTPLHNTIPFEQLTKVLDAGYANSIRFSHEASVLPEHKSLFLDEEPIDILGVPLLRTKQWSGRPQLVRTDFYRTIANKYWDDVPRFIEHIMYGVCVEGDFDEFRLHLYAPPDTYVTSKHTDGRRHGAESYDPNPSR